MFALGGAFTVFVAGILAWLVLRWVGDALSSAASTDAERTDAERTDAERTDAERTDAERTDAERTDAERVPFAGGYEPVVHAWSRYHVRYYAMALLFLAFDMEMVFMYPWAMVFVREGAKALVEMLMFIVILVLGILYAWREGVFRWA